MALMTVVTLAILGLPGTQARAATITPSVLTDDNTVNGNCTLREAIRAANGNAAVDQCSAGAPGLDTIELAAGTYLVSLGPAGDDMAATGDLDVRESLLIRGKGPGVTIIDAQALDRVLDVPLGLGPRTLEVTELTIRGGSIANTNHGGGIRVDEDNVTLTVSDAVVTGNYSDQGGGGISINRPTSTLVLARVSVTDNRAGDDANSASGGGIEVPYGLTMSDSLVEGNIATSSGGGIEARGEVTITRSTLRGNRTDALPMSSAGGGGLSMSAGTLTITDSAIIGNAADGNGGGGLDLGATTTLTNVTISGNTDTSPGGYGGGIYWGGAGSFALTNVTITDNAASPGMGGGISNYGLGTFMVRDSIVAANGTPECDQNKPITSAGHNIQGDGTCGFSQSTDILYARPGLAPLADNGGPTETHALLDYSPAIDAGGTDCAADDQRGLPRGRCDIGAYELVLCRKVAVNRFGTRGNDELSGTAGADGILGLEGRDALKGKGGKDALCGGPGNDTLKGGGGNDILDGQTGSDVCIGQGGNDKARSCEKEQSL